MQVVPELVGSVPIIPVIPVSQFAGTVYVLPPQLRTASPFASVVTVATVAPEAFLMVIVVSVPPSEPSSEKQVVPFLLTVALKAADEASSEMVLTTFTPFE